MLMYSCCSQYPSLCHARICLSIVVVQAAFHISILDLHFPAAAARLVRLIFHFTKKLLNLNLHFRLRSAILYRKGAVFLSGSISVARFPQEEITLTLLFNLLLLA